MLHLRQPLFTGKQQAVSRAIRGTGRRPGPEETPKAPTIPIPDIPQKKKPKGKPVPEQREAPPQDGHAKGRYAGKVSRRDKTICVILGIFVVCLLLYAGYRILGPHWSSADQPVVTTPCPPARRCHA